MQEKFDPKVFQLGYVALGTPDLAHARDHYVRLLGLTEVARGEDGAAYLSVGYGHHDIVLRPASEQTLLHIGLQLAPHVTVADMARLARDAGLAADIKHDSQPGVAELVEVVAPGGVRLELFGQMAAPAPGFGQTAAAPLRLGHVAVMSPDGQALVDFCRQVLGFVRTDDIGGIAQFLTCNRDHHVLNIAAIPLSRVHHIAFELRDSAQHIPAADALRQAGRPVLWGPARHTAGHNIAAYHHDPDRVMIELYTEMDVFVPALGMCEPRPWHEQLPMTPRSWPLENMNAWGPEFGFNLAGG